MRYLSLGSAVVVVAGILLMTASRFAGLGPVAFVGGALLCWSGVVKVLVVRIWKSTLGSPPTVERGAPAAGSPRMDEGQP